MKKIILNIVILVPFLLLMIKIFNINFDIGSYILGCLAMTINRAINEY